MVTEEKYRKLLDAAVEFNKTHRINPLEQGNLFTILDIENKEVSAHSAFLYFVFKPFQQADDKYDDKNLRELLKELLNSKKDNHKNIDEYEYLDIRREVATEFGRLDFVIDADDETFVIELKVWAGEQHEQIPRYRQYLIKQGADENNIFFLTPLERPSETGESINLTLKDNIKPILESICNSRKADYGKYATMIEQYISIIDKLTQGEFYMGETVNTIETAEDLKAVERLIENRNNCMQKIMVEFYNKLGNRLTDQLNIDGCPQALSVYYKHGRESVYNYYSETNRYPALTYEIADHTLKSGCKLKENVNLYFFVEVSVNLYCGISPRKTTPSGELEKIECEDAVDPYQAFNINLRKVPKAKHDKTFPIWEHLTVSQRKVNFSLGALNGNDSILNLLEKNSLSIKENVIDDLAIKILNSYKKYCQAIYEIE